MEVFLLVFHSDGVLVNSVPDLNAALNEMLRERGRWPFGSSQGGRHIAAARLLLAGTLPKRQLGGTR